MTALRDAAIALAATALMASPALAQQGNWNGSQGYQGTAGQRGYSQEYNEGTSQGWNQNSNAAAPGTNGELSQATLEEVQERLQQMGFYHGNIDGNWGPETQSALRDYQQQHGMQPNGQLDFPTMADLGLVGRQNQQFGNNQYGTPNTGNQFGNNGGQGSSSMGMNGNTTSGNPHYQGQNNHNSGATYSNGMSGTNGYNGNGTAYNSSSNRSNNNNGMAGTNGYNGNYDTGSNQGSTGYNTNNGTYSGYSGNNHNNMNSGGTYNTGMNNPNNNGNLNTRFGNGNPNGTTGQQ